MALLARQRMVWGSRSGSVTFWAWTASVAVHLVVLTALGFVKFSGAKAGVEQRPVPTAKINQIKKLMEATSVIPKPKVKRSAKEEFAKTSERLLPVSQTFGAVRPISEGREASLTGGWPSLAKPAASMSEFSLPSSANLRQGIEFFGSFADERKVCFLVDCSGSMQGVFGEVRKKLSESVGKLQPDQYFYIIFFGGGKLFELGGGKLLRATEKAKSGAYKFIDSIKPAGRTNAPAAFERAAQICNSAGQSSVVVYFLTDGFELTAEGGQGFSQKAAGLPAKFAPATRINTIGFCPRSDDREMLRTIAKQSGGEFVLIEGY